MDARKFNELMKSKGVGFNRTYCKCLQEILSGEFDKNGSFTNGPDVNCQDGGRKLYKWLRFYGYKEASPERQQMAVQFVKGLRKTSGNKAEKDYLDWKAKHKVTVTKTTASGNKVTLKEKVILPKKKGSVAEEFNKAVEILWTIGHRVDTEEKYRYFVDKMRQVFDNLGWVKNHPEYVYHGDYVDSEYVLDK